MESVYIRENGQLYRLNQSSSGVNVHVLKPKPSRLFSKGFSIELCMNRENDNGRTDHFIFTYTKEGNLRYSAKSLFSLVLSYIADNIHHVDSLIGFPEQIGEKLFYAADARQKFTEPRTGLRALQKFTDAYGSLVLQILCLKNRYVQARNPPRLFSFPEASFLFLLPYLFTTHQPTYLPLCLPFPLLFFPWYPFFGKTVANLCSAILGQLYGREHGRTCWGTSLLPLSLLLAALISSPFLSPLAFFPSSNQPFIGLPSSAIFYYLFTNFLPSFLLNYIVLLASILSFLSSKQCWKAAWDYG